MLAIQMVKQGKLGRAFYQNFSYPQTSILKTQLAIFQKIWPSNLIFGRQIDKMAVL